MTVVDSKHDRLSSMIANIIHYSRDELLEHFYSLFIAKLPNAKVIKKNDHLVIILYGEIFRLILSKLKHWRFLKKISLFQSN